MTIDYEELSRRMKKDKADRGMTGAQLDAASKRKRRKAKRSLEKALREMKS